MQPAAVQPLHPQGCPQGLSPWEGVKKTSSPRPCSPTRPMCCSPNPDKYLQLTKRPMHGTLEFWNELEARQVKYWVSAQPAKRKKEIR